jgi:hypothetical protein
MRKLFVIGSILLLVSCIFSVNESTIQFRGDNIIPLAIGNKWIYQYTITDGDSIRFNGPMTVEIIESRIIEYEGEQLNVFVFKETCGHYSFEDSLLYYLLSTSNDTIFWVGHSVHGTFSDGYDPYYYNKNIHVIYPLQIGEKWEFDHGDYHDNFECVSLTDTVLVDEFSLSCVNIRMGNPPNWYNDYLYCPSVGLVNEYTFGSTSTYRIERILIRNILF